MSQCSSCKIHIVGALDEGGPEPPPVVVLGRSERLAEILRDERLLELWRLAAPALAKRSDGVTLSDEETFACEVLLTTVGTTLVAVRKKHRRPLATTLTIVSGRVLGAAAALEVLSECEAYLANEGKAACLAAAAERLEEAGLRETGYELVVGFVLVRGTISGEQGAALDETAQALGFSRDEATRIRARVARAMA